MPAQAGARYIRRERVATLESVEAGWVALWRQVDPLPVESKAELQFLIESYLRRNKPAAPPSAVVKGRDLSNFGERGQTGGARWSDRSGDFWVFCSRGGDVRFLGVGGWNDVV